MSVERIQIIHEFCHLYTKLEVIKGLIALRFTRYKKERKVRPATETRARTGNDYSIVSFITCEK